MLRSLLPLALACVAWTLPAMARLPRCPHRCDPPQLKGNPGECYDTTIPERRALLNTIRHAEGTMEQGKDGYRVLFGGTMVDDLKRHPKKVISKGRYTSAAAGAYQFLPPTWEIAKKALKLRDFGPDSQDQAALFLIQRRCALPLANEGKLKLTEELVDKLAPEWASFPKVNGKSYYGQPVRRFRDLERFYYPQLANLVSQRPEQQLAAGPPPVPPKLKLASRPVSTPTRWIPVATSASCDGELMCLLDHVAAGGVPIQPGSIISQS